MNLNKEERQFIKKNRYFFNDLFNRRVAELKQEVFDMPASSERDMKIEFINEYRYWLKLVKIITEEKEPTDSSYI